MRARLFLLAVVSCTLVWSACDDDHPTDPLGVDSDDLSPGRAVWVMGKSDRFEGWARFEHRPATEGSEARTTITLWTDATASGNGVEVQIGVPELAGPVTHTEEGCEAFVSVDGYDTPIDDSGVGWRSCCGIPGQQCAGRATRCTIDEVSAQGIRGDVDAVLLYKSGFVLFDSLRIRGVFYAVEAE